MVYSSDVDIGWFQFKHNGCVDNAAGGQAALNGFTVSVTDNSVIGVSFKGSTIPPSENISTFHIYKDESNVDSFGRQINSVIPKLLDSSSN